MPDPFIEQLKGLCRDKPIEAKWVFVPHAGLRWTLGERLLHEGCNWLNLRLVTPLQLALEAAAPGLLERGINPCPETLGPSLLQNLLLQRDERPGYFLPLILQPGMAEALWSTLSEFRLTGLRARDLQPTSDKMKELKRLFQDYEDYLEQQRLADRAMLLQSDPIFSAEDEVLVYPYCRWSPLERRWLSKLSATTAMAALDAPQGWRPRQVVAVAPLSLEFFWATRRCDEVDEVAWRLRRQATPLDQVEIAAAQEDYGLIADRMAAVGFPCTFDSGLPMVHCRPGQALDGVLTWLEHGLTAHHLRQMLQADLLCAQPDSFSAARLLEAAQITWGRETYHPQLQALAQATQRRALRQGLSPRLSEIDDLQEWLRNFFQRLPPPNAEGQIQPLRWLAGLQQTLIQDFRVRDSPEEGARTLLLRALEELKLLPGEHWPQARFLALVRQRIRALRAQTSRPRPGHIHVTCPESLGLSGRPVAFWIGLEEGRLLRPAVPDCVFSDEERASLHPDLSDSTQAARDRLFCIRERLRTFSGKLTLSYAGRDMTGEQEQLPAWHYLEAVRGQHPAIDTYDKLSHWLGPAAQPPQPPCQQKLRLQCGAEAEARRASLEFTIYDGLVPSAAGLWDPRQNGTPISVSRLQALATCPFQVFLEMGLGLQPPLQLPEPESWLDAATRGSLLHEIYATYHRGLRARGWRPDLERDRRQLKVLLDQQLELIRAVLPPPSAALEKAERKALHKDLLHFLQLELDSPERRPIGLEVPFGMGPDELEPLAHGEPVVLEMRDGQKLPLRGRIDRIDQIGDHYGVVDYKTGRRLYTSKRQAVFDRGRLLQHAPYALVVEQMLAAPGRVTTSSYYFPTCAAARPWNHYAYPDKENFLRVLDEVLEPLKTGAFAHTHESGQDCAFCPYRPACEAHVDANQKAKVENPANVLLDSRRRLLEEE